MNENDLKRKADAAAATDATKTKLWTPDQKVPEHVRKMALLLFVEAYKALLAGHANLKTWIAEDEYRACINLAKMVDRVDHENDQKT